MTKRHVSTICLCAIGALLLTQFQNCAPAGSISAASSAAGSGQARVIEDFGSAELAFATAQVQLKDEVARATVSGLCTRQHDGARLRWSIVGDDARAMLTGDGVCANGQFKLQLSEMNEMVCGITHQLVVEGDWGGSATTPFTRRCQPVMSEPVDASNLPYGTSCELEYQPAAGDQGPGCVRVCYREDQVIDLTKVGAASCAPMASRLAGP